MGVLQSAIVERQQEARRAFIAAVWANKSTPRQLLDLSAAAQLDVGQAEELIGKIEVLRRILPQADLLAPAEAELRRLQGAYTTLQATNNAKIDELGLEIETALAGIESARVATLEPRRAFAELAKAVNHSLLPPEFTPPVVVDRMKADADDEAKRYKVSQERQRLWGAAQSAQARRDALVADLKDLRTFHGVPTNTERSGLVFDPSSLDSGPERAALVEKGEKLLADTNAELAMLKSQFDKTT
jgi:hypothetical protein